MQKKAFRTFIRGKWVEHILEGNKVPIRHLRSYKHFPLECQYCSQA